MLNKFTFQSENLIVHYIRFRFKDNDLLKEKIAN